MAAAAGQRDFNDELHQLVDGRAGIAAFEDLFDDAAAAGHEFDASFLADRLARVLYLDYNRAGGVGVQVAILGEFLRAGLSPNAKTTQGTPILTTAFRRVKYPVLAALIESGANPNEPSTRGEFPLMSAMETYSPELVAFLLEHGADPMMARLPAGETFLNLIESGRHARFGEFAEPLPPHLQGRRGEMFERLRVLANERKQQIDRNAVKLMQLRRIATKAGIPENVEGSVMKGMLNLETRGPGISVQNAHRLLAAMRRYEESQAAAGGRRSSSSSNRRSSSSNRRSSSSTRRRSGGNATGAGARKTRSRT
jgi:hypothetical protein